MGFEPFIPPKRTPQPQIEGTRDERVLALAKLLHGRGITSSLTDAKRLAEGMVDVERKVMKQPQKEQKATEMNIPAPKPVTSSFGLRLSDEFSHFVAEAAALSHEKDVV